MQFALPPRKNPPLPYAHSPRISFQRKKQLKAVALLAFAVLSVLFLLSHVFASATSSPATGPAGTSSVVIVTVVDREALSDSYIRKIVSNREDYAKRHGYTNFIANTTDYTSYLEHAPRSWSIVTGMRHAMASHPHSTYFFHLDPHALIMNPSKSLHSHILEKSELESRMLKDVSVVPPDSVVKTFSHLKASDIDLIISRDKEDLNPGSFVLRQGDFASFFLDLWFDPLFRAYNFAKAEVHALDHIVQWHPTVLARMAVVPQRTLNAYSRDSTGAAIDGTYKEGDLVLRFFGCDLDAKRSCEGEMEPFYNLWKKKVKSD
ncbi:Alpha-1,6-mannosyltransferase subunit [Aspergillus sclerotialis]|uniref:Alpha-1,6-mannosyltransferase subunit n=1 Tax=Aspergillus sclerotialis TaxID=2070753 RepID=A0A3A2ZIW9_9EURO|nr:Alpha-1,6-mannosyltransferase subunit [Aspergillus sclerotialis]